MGGRERLSLIEGVWKSKKKRATERLLLGRCALKDVCSPSGRTGGGNSLAGPRLSRRRSRKRGKKSDNLKNQLPRLHSLSNRQSRGFPRRSRASLGGERENSTVRSRPPSLRCTCKKLGGGETDDGEEEEKAGVRRDKRGLGSSEAIGRNGRFPLSCSSKPLPLFTLRERGSMSLRSKGWVVGFRHGDCGGNEVTFHLLRFLRDRPQ